MKKAFIVLCFLIVAAFVIVYFTSWDRRSYDPVIVTITPGGTTGARTINTAAGTVNFATAASTLVVTNNLVTANSLVFCVVRTGDATAVLKSVVPISGSFTITMNAATTSETSVGFLVKN